MRNNFLRRFLNVESTGGILLFLMAAIALVLTNSPFAIPYENFFITPLNIKVGGLLLDRSLLFWINEGLMSLFFLLVGLELKREFSVGELREPHTRILPGVAALGGMLVPAVIYLACNLHAVTSKGWATPVATDIAFALSAVSYTHLTLPTKA